MEGWGWQSVHDPQTLEVVKRRWGSCLATGQPFEMTFPLRSASGEFRPFLTRVHPCRDEAGVITAWFGNNIEISAQMAAEDGLRQANIELKSTVADALYLASIVESSNDAIIGKGLDGRIKSWNRAAEAMFGYGGEEVIGRNISLLFPPDRLAEEAAIIGRIRSGERVEPHETQRRRKDGSDVTVALTVSPIRDAQGVIVGASSNVRDISERLIAQRALARSEAEFRASFEGSAVGRAIAEPTTRRILRANRTLAGMLGYQPDEMIGRSTAEFIWPEDRADDEADYARLLAGHADAYVSEQRYVRRGGAPLWVRVSASLARVPDSSTPVLAVMAVEDIDIRHRVQADLLEAKRELERVVAERTAALDQRNLLLREVYHRVKNNLQIVDGLLMMQALKMDDAGSKAAVMGVRRRIFALGLVHQQLMGSADLKTFAIAPFLEELSKNIVEGGASAAVTISVEAGALDVGLDFAVPLGLLVTELVTNCLKHAFPSGVGKILVSLKPDAEGMVLLVVSDDGVGLPAPDRAKAGGVGLGTGIVRSLVTQLEGEMTFGAGPGAKTQIRVPMPVQP